MKASEFFLCMAGIFICALLIEALNGSLNGVIYTSIGLFVSIIWTIKSHSLK